MKPLLQLSLALALWNGVSHAQDTPSGQVQPSLQELEAARELARVARLWNKPLDWKEKDSSTADVAAHIQQALGVGAPSIEVRGQDENHLTFALKQAPMGSTLTAIADLNNFKIWMFPNRLVVAPEKALLPEERGALRRGLGGTWEQNPTSGGKPFRPQAEVNRLSVLFVGLELKQLLTEKGTLPAIPVTASPEASLGSATVEEAMKRVRELQARPLPYELVMEELSAESQDILQELIKFKLGKEGAPLAPSTTFVSFDDTQAMRLELRLQIAKADAPSGRQELGRWYANKPLLESP